MIKYTTTEERHTETKKHTCSSHEHVHHHDSTHTHYQNEPIYQYANEAVCPQDTTHSHEQEGEDCCAHSHGHEESNPKVLRLRFGLSCLSFAIGLLFLAFPKEIVWPIPMLLSTLFFLISYAISGYSVLYASIKNISKGIIFDENFLMSIATIGAFILYEWTEGAAVMLFYNLGELIQHKAVSKTRKSIIALMDVRPESARLWHNPHDPKDAPLQKGEIVSPDAVPLGSYILVKPGEKVPLDGKIIEGATSFDTSSMTGESVPRNAMVGDTVLAGFINGEGVIVIYTTATAQNSAATKMLSLIQESQKNKAETEKFITSFARIYTPIVTFAAILLTLVPPLVSVFLFNEEFHGWQTFAPWFSRSLVFLVISCPCALVISVPLGYFGGIGRLAKNGILVKGAEYIDAFIKAKAIVFDKTGTLTQGLLKVEEIKVRDTFTKEQLLELAFIAEQNSNHPIAVAIKSYAEKMLGTQRIQEIITQKVSDYTEKAGFGVSVLYQKKKLNAGSALFITTLLNNKTSLFESELPGTQVHFCYENAYVGSITLTDTLKDNAIEGIADLKRMGITNITMLTGDTKKSARVIAEQLDIESYCAECLPHQKVEYFESISNALKEENKTATTIFVGDGINDAPVIARADIGIASGALGSDATMEAADVVLMNDNPRMIAQAITISRYTRKIVTENIGIAFGVKCLFLFLGALGFIGLWAAVFADVGVTLLAIFNSVRILWYKPR